MIMGKKLTEQEREERVVRNILAQIKRLEKRYPQVFVERACYRYKQANLEKRKAEKEIGELNEKLESAKKKLN